MNYIVHTDAVEITGVTDFSLPAIFECGQCFRWNADEKGVYSGVAYARATRIRRDGNSVFIETSEDDFLTIWRDYFDLDTDYAEIRRLVAIDGYMRRAAEFGAGIRILRQEKWETLCSFIISQCNNIPRIKKIVEALSELFGEKLGGGIYAFPAAERVAGLREDELSPLRAGYRAKYIIEAANAVASGALALDGLALLPPADALAELKKLPGVGDKVASCAVLFGLHMLDSFPIDTWMRKAIISHYGNDFDPIVFSPYAGVAQQYMFFYERSGVGQT